MVLDQGGIDQPVMRAEMGPKRLSRHWACTTQDDWVLFGDAHLSS
jgi:hypothetical protein